MQPLLAEHFKGGAMSGQVSISDLEMAGWIEVQSPNGPELVAGCRRPRPGQPRSRELYQQPDHLTDPRENGSTLSTQTIHAATSKADGLEVQLEDDAGTSAQEHCLTFPHASRHHVCPNCSTIAELLIQHSLTNMQGTEELAKKVAYTQRKVQAMESKVLLLLQQQQQEDYGAVWHGLLADVATQQKHHLQNVEQLRNKIDTLAESWGQLHSWQ